MKTEDNRILILIDMNMDARRKLYRGGTKPKRAHFSFKRPPIFRKKYWPSEGNFLRVMHGGPFDGSFLRIMHGGPLREVFYA